MNTKQRRQRHGQAWHWKQTDCWYYTPPSTKKRMPLLDEDGRRIRGKDNKKAADLALARVKLAGKWRPTAAPTGEGEWLVAKVCSKYIEYCEHGVAANTISKGHLEGTVRYLNELCNYCGALPVSQLKKGHARTWVSGNVEAEYVDAEQMVLRNKKGIMGLRILQVAEEEALAAAYETLLGEVRMDTPLTCDLLQHIHARIFGDLYAWAGRWRTVWISKPGITWPAPDFLERNMQAFEREVLAKYRPSLLASDEQYAAAVAEIQGEFLVIHPFREGNARTIKLATDLLALQTGRPLLVYDQSEQGQERYIAAAKAAFKRNYTPMTAVIQTALSRARRGG